MAKFKKAALYAGTWHPPGRAPVTFDAPRLKHLTQRLKDMVADGLPVPISWEHQDKAKPMTAEERQRLAAEDVKLFAGDALSATLSPKGAMQVELDIPDEADARKFEAVKFVSPKIEIDFKDGRGKVWPGESITHLAVTKRPVQTPQEPPVRLSYLCLSLDDYQGDVVATGSEPDLGQDDFDDDEPEADEQLKQLLEALAKSAIGLPLPDDTDRENIIERLLTAAMVKLAAEGEPMTKPINPAAPAAGAGQANGAGAAASPEPVQMSMTPLGKQVLTLQTKDLQGQIHGLCNTGRITPKLRDDLLKDLTSQPLQLSQAGDLEPHKVTGRVEAYEMLEADSAWPATIKLSMTTGPGQPRPVADPSQPLPEDQAVNFAMKELGIQPRHAQPASA